MLNTTTPDSLNITCPANQTVNTDYGQSYATVSLPAGEISSEEPIVGLPVITIDGHGSTYTANASVRLQQTVSPYLVHYTATDKSYNSATCDMYITVLDNETPMTYNCPGVNIIPVKSSSDQVIHSWIPPRFTDNSIQPVDVVFNCLATASPECNQDGIGTFSEGVTRVMYTATDKSGNENSCGFTVTVTVVDIVCPANVTALASPGSTRTSVSWQEPDLTGWYGAANLSSSAAPGDIFLVGTHVVTYQQWFGKHGLVLKCSFFVVVVGRCSANTTDDADIGMLTWLATTAGETAESVERCPLKTMNAGLPRAVRICSVVEPPAYFQWEVLQSRGCGEVRTKITLEDVAMVPVSTGNAVEVAEFLANETSSALSDDEKDVPIDIISNILVNIVDASSGDIEVTESVLETVNNVIASYEPDLDSPDDGVSSSAIVQSVETQVTLTLRQEGKVSIQQDTIHVEALSLDPMLASNGLSFVSIQHAGQVQPQEGTLYGTEVMTFVNSKDIPRDIDVLASIRLPGNIADLLQSANDDNTTQLRASFIVYADDTLFSSARIMKSRGNNSASLEVAGSVVSLTVEDVDLVNLTEPLVIEFMAPDNVTKEDSTSVHCVFWDFALEKGVGDWSTDGCDFADLTNKRVSCNCNHATNFAILVDIKGQKYVDTPEKRALDIISQVGCSLSIIALAVTLIIYLSIRKLRSGKSRQIFIHFCISLLMLYIVFLAGVDNATGSGGGCVFVAALLHYLALTTMMWMAVEARNMYVSTVNVFPEDTPRYMVKACLIAWGSPLIVLTITLAAATDYYKNKHYCFISPGLAMYLGLLAPIGLILIHNIITFILVMRSLLKVTEASRSQQISKRLQNAIGISTLMGLTWCFGFLAIDIATFTFQLIFCLANSLQGVVVCIMFCIRREEVRNAVAPYFTRICCGYSWRLPILSAGKSTDVEMSTTPAAPTSPSSQQTSTFDLSVSAPQ